MSEKDYKSIRDGFGEGLMEAAKQDSNVVALSADLTESVRMSDFEEKYAERFFQPGIAEQNMAGIATGLALSGKTAFIGSFACFQPMRNLDQIRSSICIMNANVKIISSHAAFSYPADGIQIQELEDIAIMRALPNMQVLVPADAEQAKAMTIETAKHSGPAYLRLGRAASPYISEYAEQKEIEIGKAQVVKSGKDAYVIACGYMVDQAYKAIQELDGNIGLINMHTIKPLDTDAIMMAAETGRIITVEEHQKIGGLGSAVAEVITQTDSKARLKIVGVDDQFGETAREREPLWESRGLSVEAICEAVSSLL